MTLKFGVKMTPTLLVTPKSGVKMTPNLGVKFMLGVILGVNLGVKECDPQDDRQNDRHAKVAPARCRAVIRAVTPKMTPNLGVIVRKGDHIRGHIGDHCQKRWSYLWSY